jgi:hypothetical protein
MVKPHSPIAACKHADISQPWSGKALNGPDFGSSGLAYVPSKAPITRPRKVTFNPQVIVTEIMHKRYLSSKTFKKIWMTLEEYESIMTHMKKTIRMITRGECIDEEDDHYCVRGLEAKTREGHKQRIQNRQSVKRAVFRQQEVQYHEGICNPEFIADVSRAKSANSAHEARDLAMQDSKEAGYGV